MNLLENKCDNDEDPNHPEEEMAYPLVYWAYQVLINGVRI